MKQWALCGLGISVRSEWDVLGDLQTGRLIRVLDEYHLPDADIVALTGSEAIARSPRARQIIQLLQQTLAARRGAPSYKHPQRSENATGRNHLF